MTCVFVYSDGQVGVRELLDGVAKAPDYRDVRRQSMHVGASSSTERLEILYDVYTRRGRMFDGRPIFCADGFEVKEAFMTALVTNEEDPQLAEALCRAEVRRFVKQAHADPPIMLDTWAGEIPLSSDEQCIYDSQMISKRGTRLLVAVRS